MEKRGTSAYKVAERREERPERKQERESKARKCTDVEERKLNSIYGG